MAWKVQKSPRQSWVPERELFRSQLDCGDSIHRALPGESKERLILSTLSADRFWDSNGAHICVRQRKDSRDTRKWIQNPWDPGLVVSLEGKEVRLCLLANLKSIHSSITTLKEPLLWQWECTIQYTRYFLSQTLEDLDVGYAAHGTHNLRENSGQRDLVFNRTVDHARV